MALATFMPGAEGGEGLESYVNADVLTGLRQRRWLSTFTREAHIPLAGTPAADGGRLGHAIQRAMQDDFHLPDVGDTQPLRLRVQLAADGNLRKCEAIVTVLAPKAWIARCLSHFDAAEERLEGEVNAHGDILQHLRLNACQRRPFGFQRGQARSLIVVTQRLLPLFPSIAPFRKQVVVQPATLLKLLIKEALLLLVRIEAILECLKHRCSTCLRLACCQAQGTLRLRATQLSSPCLKTGVFSFDQG